jgi:hypothetical protein
MADIIHLQGEAKLHETDLRMFTFNDGYAKGMVARDVLTEEEWAKFRNNNYLSMNNLALKARSGGDGDRAVSFSKKNNNLRPYQAIRKMITEQFEDKGAGANP